MAIPVAFRTKAQNSDSASGTTLSSTLNIDIGENNNRIVFVTVSGNSQDASGVTIDGQAATLIERVSRSDYIGCQQCEIWAILDTNLPVGTGNVTVQATWGTATDKRHIHAALFTGLRQQTAEAKNKAWITYEGFNEDPTVNVTSTSDNAMAYVAGTLGCGAGEALSAGTGFTLLDNTLGLAESVASEYDLNLGSNGAKTLYFSQTGTIGWWKCVGTVWTIDANPPGGGGLSPGLHQNLDGIELHEPKDVAAAEASTMYVSDGLGTGSWSHNARSTHGEMAVESNALATVTPTATDTTLNADSDYVKVDSGIWIAGHLRRVTFNIDELVVPTAGTYAIYYWANVLIPGNNQKVGVKYAINDATPYSITKAVATSASANDIINIASRHLVDLQPNDTLSLYIATDKAGDPTVLEGGLVVTYLH